MANTIAPITDGMTTEQAGRAAERFQVKCRKEGNILPKDIVQEVLEQEGDMLAQEMFAALQARVERRSKMIVRRVKVNRKRKPQEAIDATKRVQYVDPKVVADMPLGEGEEVEFVFFKPDESAYDENGLMSCAEAARQCELRGLIPDPMAQAAVNEEDPEFADKNPNGCQWQKDGKYYFATFNRWNDKRSLYVNRSDNDWNVSWLLGGVRKKVLGS